MLYNYVQIALRNLLKNRLFSALNIFGLALSMSVSLLIILLIQDSYNYDKFHADADRIYRINTEAIRKDGGVERYATSPYPMGEVFASGFTQAETLTRIVSRLNGDAVGNGKRLPVNGAFADPNFFDVFGFSLIEGNAATALKEPFTIIISERMADNFFPRESALGKTLKFGGYGEFKVSGVLAKPPGKTHIIFDAYASSASLPALERDGVLFGKFIDNWNDYYGTYTYVKLRSGAIGEGAESALAAIAQAQYNGLTLESRDADYRFYLQRLDKITPGPILSNSLGRGLPAFLLLFLSVLGGVVMLSACFNYASLTLARALARAKEIGVRKVMGASRGQIAGQLLGEGAVTALIALAGGWLLMKLIQPAFNSLSFTEFTDVAVTEKPSTFFWFVGFALFAGLLAGAIPALTMARISPASVLRKLEGLRFFKRMGLRKTLLVIQFAVSLVFIIVVTVISKQTGYMMNMEYGFKTGQILNVDLQGQSAEKVMNAFSATAGVQSVSAVSHVMGTFFDMSDDVRVRPSDEKTAIRDYFVDKNFIEQMDLPFAAGENFPENEKMGTESFAIVNEKFLEKFNLGMPAEAIGKQIIIGDSLSLLIRGVLKDFLYKPATYALEPLLLRNNSNSWTTLHVQLTAGDPTPTIAGLKRSWKETVPDREMEFEFYDQTIRESYANLNDVLYIIAVFGFIGIVIACLGLLGMVTYTVETRAKEVCLRKILGATPSDLMVLLSKNFFTVLGIAAVLAAPLGWLLSGVFLNEFVYRIPMNAGVLVPGILLLFGLGLLTIGSQTLRATMTNPVDTLRNE